MKRLALIAPVLALLFACDKGEDPNNSYEVPANYTFDNVDYSGQTARLGMFSELSTYAKSASSGNMLDAQVMLDMYANENTPFSNDDLNQSSKQIKNKTHEDYQLYFEVLFQELAEKSDSVNNTASNGQAGLLTSNTGTKTYFVNAQGLEYAQIIEKRLMGAFIAHQITNVYLGDQKMNVDNSEVTPGNGTEMEHHWDEAFGYMGLSPYFPDSANSLSFWAKYTNSRDPLLNCNETLMNAFIKGRAAISNDDLDTRDAQIEIIRETLSKIAAATAIHYCNGALADLADDALRCHQLSEAVAFADMLHLYPMAPLGLSEIQALTQPISENMYDVTVSEIETLRDELADAYELNDIKTQL